MNTIIYEITQELKTAFEKCGYDGRFAKVSLSDRPDLAEFQCNGAMAAAKEYKKPPRDIAADVAAALEGSSVFCMASPAGPGFLNLKLDASYLCGFLGHLAQSGKLGCEMSGAGKTIVLDYGGPNVAKPLHVGHLRSAIIGDSMRRLFAYLGYNTISDIHLGDWGLQMGLIIEQTRCKEPGLPYFDPCFCGQYPKEAPFTISDLERIYPKASARAKKDPDFAAAAHEDTLRLQRGDAGLTALFNHIIRISVKDLKNNYESLGVKFDVWNGESDAQKYIPQLLDILNNKGLLHESEGAMVVDVARDGDTKEIPPCIVLKSDSASLYATTDLATILQRATDYDPDMIFYAADKRQQLHFTQVFRTAEMAGLVRKETELFFLGFGTMNGKDGRPFKTRDGGVMRLEHLISDINAAVYERIMENDGFDPGEAEHTARTVGLAALKYGDLSNQATKDYVFDVERFTSFEGNTGPYILYTMVRIKSILSRCGAAGGITLHMMPASGPTEKELQLSLSRVNDTIPSACAQKAPHRLCQYIFEVCGAFNKFYHETKIITETDLKKKNGWITLLQLTLRVLEDITGILGFEAPEKM